MKKRTRISILMLLAASSCLLIGGAFLAPGCAAQSTASINGTVTDETGAVVPGAKITAVNTATGAVRTGETNGQGVYSISSVAPGVYDIIIVKQNLAGLRFANVTLSVDQALTLNAKMEVSQQEATVTVEGSQVAPIDTTDAQISSVIDAKQIQELPLILRDPYQLVLLSPGVTQTNSGLDGFSIDGARERNNNFMLDGENNNDPGVPASGLVTLNPDITQEFRVITNNYLPEFGRNAGSVIDIVTKSGTNEFHGDTYYFGRWDALGARDYFNPVSGGRKNPYIRNLFGASVGGPIKRNKLFYFFNYEGHRWDTSTESNATVPAPGFGTGIFTYTDVGSGQSANIDVSTPTSPNNAFGLALDAQIQKVLAFYPTGRNGPVLQGISDLYFFPQADLNNGNNYTARVDYNISNNNTLSVRYIANEGTDNGANTNLLPGLGGLSSTGLTQSLGLHLSTTFGANLLNDVFASANRAFETFRCNEYQTIDSLSLAGVDPLGRGRDWALPGLTAIACGPLGDSNGQDRPFGTYGIGDNLTWTKGRNTWKFGGEFADNYTNDYDNFFTRSTPAFNIFANDAVSPLQNVPAGVITDPTVYDTVWGLFGSVFQETQTQNYNLAGVRQSTDERGFRERDFYLFFQDQFKLTPNFTLSYGLRYEYDGTPWVVGDQLTSASPAALAGPPPIVFNTVTRGGANPLYVNDPKGFEPRFGFAWDPFKTGKTSIRGGYGIFRDRQFFNLTGDTRNNPPLSLPYVNNAFTNLGPVAADQISNIPIPATQPAPSNTLPQFSFAFPATISPNFHVAYSQQWNFGIQRDLGHGFVMEINYVGNKANRVLRVVDGNAPIPSLVAALRTYCQNPSNAFGCIDTPTASTVQGVNLYIGAELGVLPFDAVNNAAAFHANEVASVANSQYQGLQTQISRRFAGNYSFQANYTWSHAFDDASDAFAPQLGQVVFPANSFFLKREWGNSSYDVRNRFSANFTADLPYGKGKSHLNEGLAGKALEGWSWSGVILLQSGFPYDILAPGIDSDASGATQRPDYNPQGTLLVPPTSLSGPITGPNPGLFSFPSYGGPGNLPRNYFYGPGFRNFNMVISKLTKLNERFSLEFRTEVYNAFNHPNFNPPDDALGDFTFGQSLSEVGQPDGTTGGRQMQFALKLQF